MHKIDKIGLMTEVGLRVLPDLAKEMEVDDDIISALQSDKEVWECFISFPFLYRRVRIDKIQNERRLKRQDGYARMLAKLIAATKKDNIAYF